MDPDVPKIAKTISRKQYVREKLFNQILDEICARQCEKQNGIKYKTEYANRFSSANKESDQQKMSNYVYKLYGENSNGISFWNTTTVTNGKDHFKQYHPLTKLNSECLDEQWR